MALSPSTDLQQVAENEMTNNDYTSPTYAGNVPFYQATNKKTGLNNYLGTSTGNGMSSTDKIY